MRIGSRTSTARRPTAGAGQRRARCRRSPRIASRSTELAHRVGQRVDRRPRLGAALGRRDQAEVARRGGERVVAVDRAEHRQPDRGRPRRAAAARARSEPTRLRITPLMRVARVEAGEAVQQGGDRAALRASRRRPGSPARSSSAGDVRGRGEAVASADAARADPVEEPHHALDDRDVGERRRRRAVQEQRDDPLLADQPGVEVAAGPAGRQRVIGRVDVVRADLVRRDRQARGRAKAASRPVATLVLPCPLAGAAMTTRGMFTIRCPAGPSGRRPSGA